MKTLAIGATSSLLIVPVALASVISAPALAFDNVTVKVSFASSTVSPATFNIIVVLVSPAAKATEPVNMLPTAKSAESALPKLTV